MGTGSRWRNGWPFADAVRPPPNPSVTGPIPRLDSKRRRRPFPSRRSSRRGNQHWKTLKESRKFGRRPAVARLWRGRRSGALQLEDAGTRFVVSQTSGFSTSGRLIVVEGAGDHAFLSFHENSTFIHYRRRGLHPGFIEFVRRRTGLYPEETSDA